MSSGQRQGMDESELLQIAGDDPARARILRKSLEQLSKSDSQGALKEMAQEVLSGRIGLRQATTIAAYAEPMIEKIHGFRRDWDSMSEEERASHSREGDRIIEEYRDEIDEERRGRQREPGRSSSSARHDGKGWSLY
ncbi:hypothetical protein [Streptomyces sp. NPDC002994]|uniref:hypothetical protein n=1 Tax=Streptomyces sp. NPDC002994 TaxID=3154441 RepID=UPI0033BC353C